MKMDELRQVKHVAQIQGPCSTSCLSLIKNAGPLDSSTSNFTEKSLMEAEAGGAQVHSQSGLNSEKEYLMAPGRGQLCGRG